MTNKEAIVDLLKRKVISNRLFIDEYDEANYLVPLLIKRSKELNCDPLDLVNAVEDLINNGWFNLAFNQALERITEVTKVETVLRRRIKR